MDLKSQQCTHIRKGELKSKECVENVLQPLVEHIGIPINGSLTCENLYQTIISMAVDKNSVHSVSKRYHKVPCETSIRHHLKKLEMGELIESNEKILMQMAIENLKTGEKYEFAIDYTNDPYYGKINTSNENYVMHGQAKKSTNSFYSYVSLYIINKKERFTISVLPVETANQILNILNTLWI